MNELLAYKMNVTLLNFNRAAFNTVQTPVSDIQQPSNRFFELEDQELVSVQLLRYDF